jgi:hypothetical protein
MTTARVNGTVITVPSGCSVSVVNNEVYVNGVRYEPDLSTRELKIVVEGSVGELKVDRGSVHVSGDVAGSVNCGGSLNAHTIVGNVDAGGSVKCGAVSGKIDAGGSVRHG